MLQVYGSIRDLACEPKAKSQKTSQECEEKILSSHSFIIQFEKKTSVELSQIANMDEPPLTLDVAVTELLP